MADFSIDETADRKKPLFCPICNKAFHVIQKLQVHIPICASGGTVGTPYKCGFCDQECKSLGGLKNHEKIHDPNRLKCRWCSKTFLYSKPLRNHELKTHREDFLFEESFLDESEGEERIIDKIDLRQESTPRRNLRPKPHRIPIAKMQKNRGKDKIRDTFYRCRCCNELFAHKRDFRAHCHQSPPKLYECDFCTKMFGDEKSLKQHKEVHEMKKSLVFTASAVGYFALLTSAFKFFGLFF